MAIGLVLAAVSHGVFGSGWSHRETVWNYAGNIGFGAVLDLTHIAKRTVYRVP
jgi:hypothetical protein